VNGRESAAAAPVAAAPQRLVLRNAVMLVAAQVLATPLSLLINIVAARKLGPDAFGQLYLATTYAAFAFLFVEWGHGGAVTAMVARDRARAGELLGSSLAWRAAALPVVVAILFASCALLGYGRGFAATLALVLLGSAFATVSNACQDLLRGHERTDFGAASYVAWQLLTALVVVPTLLLGGGLHAFLLAQAACAAVGAAVLLRCLAPLGVRGVAVRRGTMATLFSTGTAFLIFSLVLALQTNLDALFLSRFASAEAIGWQAAARKLVGPLIFPASALIAALYPTLCRLHVEDAAAFGGTARSALRMTLIAAAPVALGCALFPQLGIALFGERGYGPAADNLRVLALYILLVYFTMPLGTALVAAGRQRAWAVVQFGCVLISAVLDPLLIPWFQRHGGNGGLGVCVSTAVSEVLMVAGGLSLLPAGVLGVDLRRTLYAVSAAGAAMAAAALLLAPLGPYLSAPLALAVYAGSIVLSGEVGAAQVAMLRTLLRPPVPAARNR
jgi:O-antigen/teichoic acid export membrane protein